MSRVGFACIGVAAAVLGAVIAGEIAGGGSEPPAVVAVSRPDSGSTAAERPSARLEAQWTSAILARPLFDPSRRPPGGPASAAGALRLSAVIVGPFGRQAIFEPAAGGKPVVVQVGERVGSAVVRAIEPDVVLVVGTDGPRALQPSYGASRGSPARPAAHHLSSLAVRLMEAK